MMENEVVRDQNQNKQEDIYSGPFTRLASKFVASVGEVLRDYGIDTDKLQPGKLFNLTVSLKESSFNYARNVLWNLYMRDDLRKISSLTNHDVAYELIRIEQLEGLVDKYLTDRLRSVQSTTWEDVINSKDIQMDHIINSSAELLLKAVSTYTVYWGYKHLDFYTASKMAFILRTFFRFENYFQAGYTYLRWNQELKTIPEGADRQNYNKHMRATLLFSLTPILGAFSGFVINLHKYDPERFHQIQNLSDYYNYIENISGLDKKLVYMKVKPALIAIAGTFISNYYFVRAYSEEYQKGLLELASRMKIVP